MKIEGWLTAHLHSGALELVLHVRRLSDDFEDIEDTEDDEETLEKVVDKVIAGPFHCLHFSIWNRYATKVSFHVSL